MKIGELEIAEFDLAVYRKQYKYCKDAIENGNWDNYSESLKIRKEQLQVLSEIIELLEIKIKRLKNK
ncbi:MAG: hypothetical protein ACK5P0_01945 [bacterium]|jgi:hypothetical protein